MNTTTGNNTDPHTHPFGQASFATSILVVDDERAIVSFMTDLLEDEGYAVTEAYDGLQALNILRRNPPRLVISDVLMPGVSGDDVFRFINETSFPETPKVILMSANLNRSPFAHIPLLHKPFDINELLALVDQTLGETQMNGPH